MDVQADGILNGFPWLVSIVMSIQQPGWSNFPYCTPGSTNIAGWKMGAPDGVDVFPVENGDIPACYVSETQRVKDEHFGSQQVGGCFAVFPSFRCSVQTFHRDLGSSSPMNTKESLHHEPWMHEFSGHLRGFFGRFPAGLKNLDLRKIPWKIATSYVFLLQHHF